MITVLLTVQIHLETDDNITVNHEWLKIHLKYIVIVMTKH